MPNICGQAIMMIILTLIPYYIWDVTNMMIFPDLIYI